MSLETTYERESGRSFTRHTLTYRQDGTLPTWEVMKLPSFGGEWREPTGEGFGQYTRDDWAEFLTDVAEHGITNPIWLRVSYDNRGTPRVYLYEGNHRIQAAHELGLPAVPVRIDYYAGVEQDLRFDAEGHLHRQPTERRPELGRRHRHDPQRPYTVGQIRYRGRLYRAARSTEFDSADQEVLITSIEDDGLVPGWRYIDEYENEPHPGDALPCSYDWEAEEETILPGTCAFYNLDDALEYARHSEGWLVLVGGVDKGYGTMAGEIILADAVVYGVWERDNSSALWSRAIC
jgi:hypothetical protein